MLLYFIWCPNDAYGTCEWDYDRILSYNDLLDQIAYAQMSMKQSYSVIKFIVCNYFCCTHVISNCTVGLFIYLWKPNEAIHKISTDWLMSTPRCVSILVHAGAHWKLGRLTAHSQGNEKWKQMPRREMWARQLFFFFFSILQNMCYLGFRLHDQSLYVGDIWDNICQVSLTAQLFTPTNSLSIYTVFALCLVEYERCRSWRTNGTMKDHHCKRLLLATWSGN